MITENENFKCKETNFSNNDLSDNIYSEKDELITEGFLGKKKKRLERSSEKKFSKKINSKSEDPRRNLKRCDVCLEFEKYSSTRLIECAGCKGKCHAKCIDSDIKVGVVQLSGQRETISSEQELFKCIRCQENGKLKAKKHLLKCVLCGEYEGILHKVENGSKQPEFVHSRCLRFLPEIFTPEVENTPKNKTKANADSDKASILQKMIRKWRTKYSCKEGDNKGLLVIKCLNTKCKNYYHIPCAIKKSMIIALDFMSDYYGISSPEKYKHPINFYCNNHNRNLIQSYDTFIDELEQAINLEVKEEQCFYNMHKEIKTDFDQRLLQKEKKSPETKFDEMTKDDYNNDNLNQYSEFNCGSYENISNLQHPEFKFATPIPFMDDQISIKSLPLSNKIFESEGDNYPHIYTSPVGFNNFPLSNLTTAETYSLPNEVNQLFKSIKNEINLDEIAPMKPKYSHEDLLFPEDEIFRPTSNFHCVSKQFYDYFDKDISQINKDGTSAVTISQIRDLKEFVLKIIKNYQNFDADFLKINQYLYQ